ncbi:cell division protein SepF [Neoactinobaculum massilliense]|uniref:cell division protein SepF n=1 Tax=Neoactinobaculum massilliense TaxID=2364794 RepID=UPI000F536EE7|nr:cell division protein SepF [Neoactinobaculum massilliense]
MGMFQRFVSKATLNDDDFAEDEDYFEDGEEYAEPEGTDTDVSPIRAVAPAVDIARIVTAKPASFADVRGFAEKFRSGLPVILNLAAADDAARHRIVDFATGLCFGLHGDLNKISGEVILMTPHSVHLESQRPDGDSL